MFVGYARVSTADQTLSLQQDALHTVGCTRVFTDTASGSSAASPGLDAALDDVRVGDTLVVWRLDRLGRSLRHLLETVRQLEAREIGFRSLTEQIDTTTSSGRLIFHIFASLAEFERALIRERTQAGLAAAHARVWKGGRPRAAALQDAKKLARARELYASQQMSVQEICQWLGVSRSTFYAYVPPRQAAT